MKKIITFLFLANFIVAIVWFNFKLYVNATGTQAEPEKIAYAQKKQNKDQKGALIQTAQSFFINEIVTKVVLKRF